MGLTTCHKGSDTEETVNEEGERLILAKVVFGEDGFCSNDTVSFFRVMYAALVVDRSDFIVVVLS